MCNPAVIPYVIAAVAAAAEGYSNYQEGKFNKGVSEYNARQLENQATRTRNKGTEAENEQRRRTAELISTQRAQAAGQGVDVDSGSALQLQEDAVLLGEVDALRIRENFSQEAESLEDQARLEIAKGKNAYKTGRRSLISGGIVAGGKAYQGSTAAGGPGYGTEVSSSWYNSNSAATQSSSVGAIK